MRPLGGPPGWREADEPASGAEVCVIVGICYARPTLSIPSRPRSAALRRLHPWLGTGLAVIAVHLALLRLMSSEGVVDGSPQTPESVVMASLLIPDVLDPVAPDEPRSSAPALSRPVPAATEVPTRPEPAHADVDADEAAALPAAGDEPDAGFEPAPEREPETAPAPASRPVAAAPASARLQYEVEGHSKGLRYGANAVLDWRQDGELYQATLEVSAFLLGSRSQSSSGRLDAGGLRPERFLDRARRDRLTLFDHETGQVRQDSGSPRPMPPGTQDKLSVFLQLALQLAALGRTPTPSERWTLPVAASNTVESWTFDYRGSEVLSLPAGPITAWHFESQPHGPGETTVELWLAPELGLLPVRLRLSQDNGDSVDQRLSRR